MDPGSSHSEFACLDSGRGLAVPSPDATSFPSVPDRTLGRRWEPRNWRVTTDPRQAPAPVQRLAAVAPAARARTAGRAVFQMLLESLRLVDAKPDHGTRLLISSLSA